MNDAQFDRLFDTAFEVFSEQSSSNPSVDYRPSWLRMQQKLISSRKRKGLRSKLTRLTVIAASLILGAAIFGNTQAVRAIDPLYATIKEYPSGVMGFFFGRAEDTDNPKAKTAPPPEFAEGLDTAELNEGLHMAVVTEAQASKMLSFAAPVFHYIPTGYAFSNAQVYLYGDRKTADHVAYQFINDNEKIMHVTLDTMKTNLGLGVSKNAEGIIVEKIQLSDGPAILTSAESGSTSLETIKGGTHITMSGIVPADELIRMYEEME